MRAWCIAYRYFPKVARFVTAVVIDRLAASRRRQCVHSALRIVTSLPCCGARRKLRLSKQSRFLPTAATRSGRSFRPRRRSPRSPARFVTAVVTDLLSEQKSKTHVILSEAAKRRSRRIRNPKKRILRLAALAQDDPVIWQLVQ